jgi:hypothetical protein
MTQMTPGVWQATVSWRQWKATWHSLHSYSLKMPSRYAISKHQAGLAFPSDIDMKWALQSNMIKDCPLSVKDLRTATKVYGKSIAMLKGKTVRSAPPVVRQNVIEIPKEIWVLHKMVTLCIDIFFVNKIPFFITYSLVICFLSVTHLSGQKALVIFKALKAMCNYYLQRGFQVVFIKGDGEFKPLQAFMDTVYGTPQLNVTSANEHVPDVERKIRVVKERVRAIIYSIPFNALPAQVLIHAVLFAAKQLNLFPVKGGGRDISALGKSCLVRCPITNIVTWVLAGTAKFMRRTSRETA